MFFVGRKVVCVNARNWPAFRYVPEMLPVEGRTYTVFDVRQNADWDEQGVLLHELVNMAPSGVEWLLYFRASRFRPVRTTNIDVFLKMLEPVPVREPVEEEAVDLTDEPVRFVLSAPPGCFVGWRAAAEMLTPSEIQSLRREAKETSAYCRRAFARLRAAPESEWWRDK